MAISGIGSQISSLQAIRAQNAFQKTQKISEESQKSPQKIEEDIEVSISSKAISEKDNAYMKELKNFAQSYNINDVDEEDIHNALKYGTSLFADYSA